MKRFKSIFQVLMALLLVFGALGALPAMSVSADSTSQLLPFSQNWADTNMITTNDIWTGVPGIVGYLGDYTTSTPANVDPQTLLLDYSSVAVDVIANQSNPATNSAGGVAEFDGITDPVVALQGSGTADAPYLLINLTTAGKQDITVSYLVRDIDAAVDNAVQQVALHYRVGSAGDFTNVPAAYIMDATTGPSLATKETPVLVTLPAAANNQSLVQLRIMTTNATGSDEWVGIDNISITGSSFTTVSSIPAQNDQYVDPRANIVLTFNQDVSGLNAGVVPLMCNSVLIDYTPSYNNTTYTFTLDPVDTLPWNTSCTVNIAAAAVTPPMAEDYALTFTTDPQPADRPSVISTNPEDGDIDVSLTAPLSVTFDQRVLLVDPWYSLTCVDDPVIEIATSYSPTTTTAYEITLLDSLPAITSCTLTINKDNVSSYYNGTSWKLLENYVVSFTTMADTAPEFVSSLPANNATDVPKDTTIALTFNEPVTIDPTGAGLWCQLDGVVGITGAVSLTDPNTWIFTPSSLLGGLQACSLGVDASAVHDVDTDDPPDELATPINVTFFPVEGCGDPITPIYAIQGTGDISPVKDTTVSTEGVVVGDFQNNASVDSGSLNGFFIQDLTGDANPLTSDGIFAYYSTVDVKPGDSVRVTGKVVEYKGLTEISPVNQVLICGTATVPDPIEINFPITDPLIMEQYEGMLLKYPQQLTIAEYFNFDRFGQIVLTNGRIATFTAWHEPDVDLFANNNYAYNTSKIVLDDGNSSQNPVVLRHPDGTAFTKEHFFRGGDYVTGAIGVLDYNSDDGYYRLQPTAAATYTPETIGRQTIEELGLLQGDLTVASFNVLNYFVTLDVDSDNADDSTDPCGPSGGMDCRGADSDQPNEFMRQRAKLLDALLDIDADVFGLMEIENDRLTGEGDAVLDLVDGLNEVKGAGTYAYIDTGTIGTDAIKQAILYKPGKVTPVGAYEILDSSIDARFIDTKNRPALAQTFTDILSGKNFTVAVNHFKSKGSDCDDLLDFDLLDGQGNCNLTRKAAAEALVDWLADDTLFSQNVLIIGDLNSYDKEDPIEMIKLGSDDTDATTDDYVDMMDQFRFEYAYGYVFDGKIGYLDYALANMELAGNVVDVNFWHINADESDVFDYDMSFKPPEQEALYSIDPYRSSDHDPVLITLRFSPEAEDDSFMTDEDTPLVVAAGDGVLTNDYDTQDDSLTVTKVADVTNGSLTLNADGSFTYTPAENFFGQDSFVYKAADASQDDIATVTITINSVNDAPVAVDDSASPYEDTPWNAIGDGGVLFNDTDVEGDSLTAVLVDDVDHGTLVLDIVGTYTYTPAANFNGVDTFTYKANDGTADSNVATVTFTVSAAPDLPVANAQTVETPEETALGITLTATDADGDTLTYAVVTQPTHGTLSGIGANLTYTPITDYNGPDSFTFKANDGTADSNIATITITVTAVNDPPVAADQDVTTAEDTAKTITLGATDVDGNMLTYTIVTQPTHGILSGTAPALTYTPTAGYNGPDSFTFKANDGTVDSNIATVAITITLVNVAPVAMADAYDAIEDTELVVAAHGVLSNDTDADGDTLTALLDDTTDNGLLALNPDGSFSYMPNPGFVGQDTFTYHANDGLVGSNVVTVTITVTAKPVDTFTIYLPVIFR